MSVFNLHHDKHRESRAGTLTAAAYWFVALIAVAASLGNSRLDVGAMLGAASKGEARGEGDRAAGELALEGEMGMAGEFEMGIAGDGEGDGEGVSRHCMRWMRMLKGGSGAGSSPHSMQLQGAATSSVQRPTLKQVFPSHDPPPSKRVQPL